MNNPQLSLQRSSNKKGFTLIELLVVIAIVTILAVVVVLVLNPAQLLRQGRDSTRISDLNTLKSAIGLYLADVASPSIGASANCYAHASSGITACGRFSGGTAATSASVAVDATGWVPINFNLISSGAPLSALPRDPVNNSTYFYAYKPGPATDLTYELNAEMESTRYASGGTGDVETNDGGDSTTLYEVGTDPSLNL